ncbi:MAG: hypothetical protein ACWGG5_04200 [Stenotrophomonas sp.]
MAPASASAAASRLPIAWSPPAIGSLVTYRYNGLTRNGLPRFARFLRVREEAPPPAPRPTTGASRPPTATVDGTRYR